MTIPPRLRRTLTWLRRDILFLAAGALLHLTTAPLYVWTTVLATRTLAGTSDTAPVLLPIPLTLLALAGLGLTTAQRWRYRELCGIELPRRRSIAAARQFRYHCLVAPCLGILETLVLTLLAAATAATTIYTWIFLLPFDWRITHPAYTTQAAYVMGAGVLGLLATPRLAGALVRLEHRITPALLSNSSTESLKQRVEDLTQSRAGAVDAAAAERRRIERDLHDGAQQRLVSLALNLGIAKATLTDLPPEVRQVIDDAHREAKESIEELNTLVRGLHPAVLDELGLDAALPGLAARAPVPVKLRTDIPERAAPAVEAVAYFVVSEALTNVAKHARATRADVTVTRLGGILRVVIADDGVGGADPARGTGLTGLSQRVGSVDGTIRISSPGGGPTVMTVELPCAL